MDLAIIPECFVDTNLVETLVPPIGKGYNHQHGCGTVTKVMKEKFSNGFAVGIIDKDKREVDYLKECNTIIVTGGLLLHKHKIRHHYVIQIAPVIERMILSNALSVHINLEDYDLPSDLEQLRKVSKTENSKKDIRFKRLFRDMKAANAADLVKLEAWIKYLIEKNYKADMGVLTSL